jgi:hypothetical protein
MVTQRKALSEFEKSHHYDRHNEGIQDALMISGRPLIKNSELKSLIQLQLLSLEYLQIYLRESAGLSPCENIGQFLE